MNQERQDIHQQAEPESNMLPHLPYSALCVLILLNIGIHASNQARPNNRRDQDTHDVFGFNSTPSMDQRDLDSFSLSSPEVELDSAKPDMKLLLAGRSAATDEFHRNLSALKKMIATDAPGNTTSGSIGSNSTIDDDINTINVLIGMLMIANRRLIEQRNRNLGSPIEPSGKAVVEHQVSSSERRAFTLRAPSLNKTMKNEKSTKNRITKSPIAQTVKNKSNRKQDLILVKPGYGKKSEHRDELDQAQSDERISRRQDIHGPHGHHMFMPPHRPIIARDLLNVERSPGTTLAPYLYGSPLTTGLPVLVTQAPAVRLMGIQSPAYGAEPAPDLFAVLPRRSIQTVKQQHLGEPLVPPYNGHIMDSWRNGPSAGSIIYPSAMDNAQEQRRLEHEAKVKRRQEQVRRDHEGVMLRQRLAHERALARVTTTSKPPEEGGSEFQQDPVKNPGSPEASDQAINQQNDSAENNHAAEEPEMKGFGNFADTDFTDLFPPGILSQAEINEMKRQHQEQKRQQDQQQDEEGDSNQGDQDNQDSSGSGEEVGSHDQSETSNSSSSAISGASPSADKSNEASKSASDLSDPPNSERSRLPRPLALPNFLGGNNLNVSQPLTKKTRRSEPQIPHEVSWPSSDHHVRPFATSEPTFDEPLEPTGSLSNALFGRSQVAS